MFFLGNSLLQTKTGVVKKKLAPARAITVRFFSTAKNKFRFLVRNKEAVSKVRDSLF